MSRPKWTIHVKTTVGSLTKLECFPEDTIQSLKSQIYKNEGIADGVLSKQDIIDEDVKTTKRIDDWIYGTGDFRSFVYKIEDPDPSDNQGVVIRRKRASTFERLVRRVQRMMHLSASDARALCEEYARFLELKIASNDMDGDFLSPPDMIDEVWHMHILDTDFYHIDVGTLLGHGDDFTEHILQHDPDGAFDSKNEITRRRKNTIHAYRTRFGPKPEHQSFWKYADEDLWKSTAQLDDGLVDNLESHDAMRIHQASKVDKCSNDDQRLIFGGKQLENENTVEFYKLKNGDCIHLVRRMRGC